MISSAQRAVRLNFKPILATGFLALVIITLGCRAENAKPPASAAQTDATVDSRHDAVAQPLSSVLTAQRWGFADVAARVTPAVVNVFSARTVVTRERVNSPFWSDPFFDFFGQRYYSVPRERRETSLGSGVIVDNSGIVLTNNHVIEGAQEIQVALADGRKFTAKLLGTDPATDVAVLKIKADSLPVIPMGNSDSARIGDVVLAIGNPFGIGQTVTMGIISATGRSDVGIVDYENFIQTDAAINPGNSGGALVDVSGSLIGINTAIFSRSGGYQGIGFAVPANMARAVMQSIVSTGAVARGSLGMSFQDINESIRTAFGLEGSGGALVNEVTPDGPADKAGINRGDVITEFNGEKIADATDLRRRIALTPVGNMVDVTYKHGEHATTTKLKVTQLKTEYTYLSANSKQWVSPIEGVVVETLDRHTAERLGLRPDAQGVIIKDIVDRSPASYSGLRVGDILLEINREQVRSVDDFKNLVSRFEGKTLILLVSRGGRLYYLSLAA
ncbi:MAG: DegQ family serine endoprotease [candidate division Zixibacteria bacterium]|nr:DegQ family serine endoprotease [candidate division Zixibacteria bacterium]